MAKYKGKDINTTPTDSMASAARQGLKWREKYGRGGTAVGVARARDISNKKELSIRTINRMASYFARHGTNKSEHYSAKENDGGPTAWRIAWNLWGGNAGQSFVNRVKKSMEAAERNEEVDVDRIDEAIEEVAETEERVEAVDLSYRAMDMYESPIDEETRTAMIAVSSEEPVERSFGTEILEHSAEAIDLSFMASGRAPLLMDHDHKKQIGVVESVELGDDRRLRAKVRFGRNGLAAEAFDDVVDGIKSNISVGYSIGKLEKRGNDEYVAKSWRPVEASLVSVPADVTVGLGRAADDASPQAENPTISIKERTMEDVKPQVDVEAEVAKAKTSAQRNAAQIVELGARHNKSDMAQSAIRDGKSIEDFRGELLEAVGSERALQQSEIGLTEKEVKNFSLMRAINALANPHDRKAQEAAAFEFECSRAAAEQYGRTSQGIMLPTDVLNNWTRDLSAGTDTDMHGEDYRGGDFIDILRNESSVMRAGATILNGLSGDVRIPKKATAAASTWVTEGNTVSESEMTVSNVAMTPRHLGAFTDITRQLLQQSSLSVEALVRDDLAQAIALAIDLGALMGDGSAGQPTGINSTSGINSVVLADLGATTDVPSFAEVVEMESAVAADNALRGNLAYIMNSAMYGALKTTEKATGTAQFVVEPGNTVNGYNAIVSNQVTTGDAFFGAYQDLLVGFWSGLDILVDPYAGATAGNVRIIAMQTCDVAVRHAESFCVARHA